MEPQVRRPKFPSVVVAENNVKSRAVVCRHVGQLNCVAVPVASVSEVLEVLRSRRVDLVLLDLDLLLSQELDALEAIKQLAPQLPVVIMSLLTTPALARRMCDRGVQSFLGKPVQRDQLAVTLFRYLL